MENICKPCKPSRLCQEETCKKFASFNFKGKNKMYCHDHKQEGMVDVIHDHCQENGCGLRANYNLLGKKNGIYCVNHKKENMIDVTHQTCLECGLRPNFNFKGKKGGIYCETHKKEGMVDVVHNMCQENGCELRAGYNIKGLKKGIYCGIHKKEDMVDVVHKMCLTEHCEIRGSKKFENYCLFCFINTFPDKPVARNYKTKEKAVSDYIKQEFSEFTLITDKKLEGGCSRRRPDILLDLGYQVVIIEIDENQHEDYICENKRIMEISQDLGHRPVVFIRFNPDSYKTPQGNVTGCWGPNRKGILVVKKSKQKEWENRLETLKETVKFWLNNQTQKTIEMVHLFYDKLS